MESMHCDGDLVRFLAHGHGLWQDHCEGLGPWGWCGHFNRDRHDVSHCSATDWGTLNFAASLMGGDG